MRPRRVWTKKRPSARSTNVSTSQPASAALTTRNRAEASMREFSVNTSLPQPSIDDCFLDNLGIAGSKIARVVTYSWKHDISIWRSQYFREEIEVAHNIGPLTDTAKFTA